jgi:hypothetical protein
MWVITCEVDRALIEPAGDQFWSEAIEMLS